MKTYYTDEVGEFHGANKNHRLNFGMIQKDVGVINS